MAHPARRQLPQGLPAGAPTGPRRLNDIVFRAVYILDGKVYRPEFTEIFGPLFARPSSNKSLKVEKAFSYSNQHTDLAESLKALLSS